MALKIRRSVFETNSSSTHSLTMCTRDQFDSWRKGDLVFNDYEERFYPIDSLTQEQRNLIDEEEFYTYEGYYEMMEYETFEDSFVTPGGEEIIGFGYYGYS